MNISRAGQSEILVIQLGPNAYRRLEALGVAKEIEQTVVFPDFLMLTDTFTDK